MPSSREQEAGILYEEGAKAVRAGGHELKMLAGHLTHMIEGTSSYRGPLWPVRILHDGRKICLDRFIDYLLRPEREGLGLPSLYFLRQVLEASADRRRSLGLVRDELAKEHVDLDTRADSEAKERVEAATKQQHDEKGRFVRSDNVTTERGNSRDYTIAKLKRDRPDLAAKVIAGELSANAAAIEAGFRKKPQVTCPKCGHRFER